MVLALGLIGSGAMTEVKELEYGAECRETRGWRLPSNPLRGGGAERQRNRQQAGDKLVAAQANTVSRGRDASHGT